ncbi:uncharacterized protein Z518_09884 [Rhinocladiella mackenziei CBS 650.93]|uniref:Uncharacterized protein n=1 Tax=Rhinocladiella mackenziei CBS 650.93 TaxID=1442369 RepID=A0A0D2I4T7_9EURO|nr:uncharacterized protein Z518_09884 [Rhinocladiella mackenziei CBS 650.93]KIX00819.1 hypothetical protein Z518_09884 [Rhinocladiella mackenziei CBS 650.93]
MPASDNTPAPTRRFLPPSSTAKSSGHASARKNPFQSSRATQFPSSSSAFTATPRFQRPLAPPRDDIQTSFDEYESPTSANIRVTGNRNDAIEFGDEGSPTQYRNRILTPVTKRRKISHPGPIPDEAITISSSPDLDELNNVDPRDLSDSPVSQFDLEDNLEIPVKPTETDKSSRITRFKPTTPVSVQSTSLPRTVFKSLAEEAPHGPSGDVPVLPDVFSPSRRKGKRDYVSGGSAALVRSWVLNIAAQESQPTKLSEMVIVIAHVRKDTSGRFVVATDESGTRWLLPDQQQKRDAGIKSSLTGLRPGVRLLLKGQSTKWSLHIGPPALTDVVVAAYWENLSSN